MALTTYNLLLITYNLQLAYGKRMNDSKAIGETQVSSPCRVDFKT